jgi:hypothetical protein
MRTGMEWGRLGAALIGALAVACGGAVAGTGSQAAGSSPVDQGSGQPAPSAGPDGQTPCTPLFKAGATGAWEQIGSSLGGSAATLALDACSNPTVAVQGDGSPAFRVVRWDGSTWQQLGEPVSGAPAGDRAQYGSLAVDARDNAVLAWVQVHLATSFSERDSQAAFASRWNGKRWSAPVQLAGWTLLAFPPTVVMDAAGVATIAWNEEATTGQGSARAARWNGTAWMPIPDVPGAAPIALDTSGALLATTSSATQLSILRWDGLHWAAASGPLASTSAVAYGASATWLGVDPVGRIITTYETDRGSKSMRAHAAVWDGARWHDLPDPSSTWSLVAGMGMRAGELIAQVSEFDWTQGGAGPVEFRAFDGSSWRTFAPLPPHDGALYGVSGAIAPDGSLFAVSAAPLRGTAGQFVFRWR